MRSRERVQCAHGICPWAGERRFLRRHTITKHKTCQVLARELMPSKQAQSIINALLDMHGTNNIPEGMTGINEDFQRIQGQVCTVQWRMHNSSLLEHLNEIRNLGTYSDATIACDGGFFPVHKLMLALGSDYFKEIFSHIEAPSPVIIIKDISARDMRHILDYIYLGTVDVKTCEMVSFTAAAETLKIKGISGSLSSKIAEKFLKPDLQKEPVKKKLKTKPKPKQPLPPVKRFGPIEKKDKSLMLIHRAAKKDVENEKQANVSSLNRSSRRKKKDDLLPCMKNEEDSMNDEWNEEESYKPQKIGDTQDENYESNAEEKYKPPNIDDNHEDSEDSDIEKADSPLGHFIEEMDVEVNIEEGDTEIQKQDFECPSPENTLDKKESHTTGQKTDERSTTSRTDSEFNSDYSND